MGGLAGATLPGGDEAATVGCGVLAAFADVSGFPSAVGVCSTGPVEMPVACSISRAAAVVSLSAVLGDGDDLLQPVPATNSNANSTGSATIPFMSPPKLHRPDRRVRCVPKIAQARRRGEAHKPASAALNDGVVRRTAMLTATIEERWRETASAGSTARRTSECTPKLDGR